MPGVGGLEVARAIHRERPSLPVIVVRGSVQLLEAAVDTRGLRLVAKPFQLHELERAVREAVAPAGS